jgi:hypothetical protein
MAVIDNLMAWYPLDEASGNALDAHNAHHMTETGGTIAAATGPGGVNGARDFELDDTEYFEVADHADLSMGDIDFSLAAWVRLEGPQNPRGSLICKTALVVPEYAFEYELLFDGYNNTGKFVFRIASANNFVNFADVHSDDFGVAAGATWYFVVARHDATANTIDIGVNAGTPTSEAYSAGCWDSNSPFSIGGGVESVGPLDGLMAQAGVWKKKLTSDEITWLYNSGAGRTYAAIVAEGAVAGQPVSKRHGGVIHSHGARPLSVRRW